MTSHLRAITRTQHLTDSEFAALGPALAHNERPSFDAEDVLRLVIYRRAIQAGMYATPSQDRETVRVDGAELVLNMEWLRTGGAA